MIVFDTLIEYKQKKSLVSLKTYFYAFQSVAFSKSHSKKKFPSTLSVGAPVRVSKVFELFSFMKTSKHKNKLLVQLFLTQL